jgi:hypothetical protein
MRCDSLDFSEHRVVVRGSRRRSCTACSLRRQHVVQGDSCAAGQVAAGAVQDAVGHAEAGGAGGRGRGGGGGGGMNRYQKIMSQLHVERKRGRRAYSFRSQRKSEKACHKRSVYGSACTLRAAC